MENNASRYTYKGSCSVYRKKPYTADKGWSSSLDIGREHDYYSPLRTCYKRLPRASDFKTDALGKYIEEVNI
jgi:hypothetical protein